MKRTKKKRKETFWQREWQRYCAAWRACCQQQTLLTIGIDLLLLILLALLLILNQGIFHYLSQPIIPIFQSIQHADPLIEQELAAQYAPQVNAVVAQAVLVAAILSLLFLLLYALLKTKSWTLVQKRAFTWQLARKNFLLTLCATLLLVGIPFLLLRLSPLLAASTFVLLLFLKLFLLPLSYATSPNWKKCIKRCTMQRILSYLTTYFLLVVTWILVINILRELTVWISPVLYSLLFFAWLLLFTAWGRYYIAHFVREVLDA